MKFNSYPLPKISVDFANDIPHTEIKAVKAYAKERKYNLEDDLIVSLQQAEAQHGIHFDQVFYADATYYNNYEPPVFFIKAEAWRSGSLEDVFVHIIAQPDNFNTLHKMFTIS